MLLKNRILFLTTFCVNFTYFGGVSVVGRELGRGGDVFRWRRGVQWGKRAKTQTSGGLKGSKRANVRGGEA